MTIPAPHVQNVLHDPNRKVRYEVMAYRTLTQDELLTMVRVYLGKRKRQPKPNTRIRIDTIIGIRD